MADLAVGVLRKKRDQLTQALNGKVDDHHRLMLRKLLRALKEREAEIADDETDIRQQIEPFRKAVLAWTQIPGINEITAWSLVAEMGPDMAPFNTAEQAASWSCVCPGNHESGGKQGNGRTRKGNPWLRSAICEAAWGASRTKKSYFHAQYARICARRGPKTSVDGRSTQYGRGGLLSRQAQPQIQRPRGGLLRSAQPRARHPPCSQALDCPRL